MSDTGNMSKQDQLRYLYAAFNARDLDFILELLTDDVDWPNGMDGGRVIGKDAVRDYWQRQWGMINSTVTPLSFDERGSIVVIQVHQLVRDLVGEVLSDTVASHTYTFAGGLIERMDIGPADA